MRLRPDQHAPQLPTVPAVGVDYFFDEEVGVHILVWNTKGVPQIPAQGNALGTGANIIKTLKVFANRRTLSRFIEGTSALPWAVTCERLRG